MFLVLKGLFCIARGARQPRLGNIEGEGDLYSSQGLGEGGNQEEHDQITGGIPCSLLVSDPRGV